MAKKTTPLNRWKEHHDFLEVKKQQATPQAEIMNLCNWSRTTYFRNLKNPGNLSISDKITIANVYAMPAHFMFPELQTKTV